jgi:uncharacterized protein (UPF0333 family)
MHPSLKAQVALEFLLLAAFFLLVLVVAIGYFASLQQTELINREYLLGREVAARIADEVHAALVAGPGYVKTINLPPTVAGSYYKLYITKSPQYATAYVEIRWTRGGTNLEYSFPLASKNVGVFLNGAAKADGQIDVTHPLTIRNGDTENNRVGAIALEQTS